MLRRRPALLTRPALDDDALHATLAELRPTLQSHGLGAGSSRPPWQPVAELLRATGRDWDRRWHRMSVLADRLPATVCERWIADRPGDGDALVLRACARRASAGTWAVVKEAERACLRAAGACPEDPTPWLALLDLMYTHAVPTRDAVPVWTEAVTRAPCHRGAYHRLLRYLSPRGHGSVADMTDFAHQGAACAPHGSPLALLPVAARVELVAHRQRQMLLGADGHWNEPRAADEIEHALTGWFHTAAAPHAEVVADLNILAFALVRTHRPADAAPVFRRIGRHMTAHPWELLPEPERTFLYWRDRHRR
ncbi:hypothetical protein [Streptomyces sp. SID13726]|uniref:hypothetical protein n=1 Tax=Streptomyces sp. SID13726 TaxID=2706058 RepID=UPI0013BB50EB|nr:hypothetical protein [Streptomyces sp. SID13726]NEB01311.1 hypothetical protein [Streptomyces sp. SID13726]